MLTDDPLRAMTTITNLRAGDTVMYLTTMTNQSGWSFDYIETTVGGAGARLHPHRLPRIALRYVGKLGRLFQIRTCFTGADPSIFY